MPGAPAQTLKPVEPYACTKATLVNAQDISALDDATAEVMAAEQLLGYQPTPATPQDQAPMPPQGAALTLGIVRAMKGLGYEEKLIPDPAAGGGELYFVRAASADELPPEEEYIRYENNASSMATATCKAALIALNRSRAALALE